MQNYHDWKPPSKLSKKKAAEIAQANAAWPSGPEGGVFDSNEGIRSSSFSVIWTYLGLLGRGIPVKPTEEKKQALHNLLMSIGNTLPCRACRDNFQSNIVEAGYDPEVHLQSRQAFSRFINHLHNTVNRMLGKPEWAYDDHRDMFEVLRAKCTPKKGKKEGGCAGALTKEDRKATCMVTFVPSDLSKAFKESTLELHAQCMLPKPNLKPKSSRKKKTKKKTSTTRRNSPKSKSKKNSRNR